MNLIKKTGSASLALLAIASLLAGCSGGGSKSVLPSTPSATGPAPQSALVSGVYALQFSRTQTSVTNRAIKFIPATANSVTIFAVNSPSGPGQPVYYPTAGCANLPASGTGTVSIPYTAPVGNDYFVISVSTGTCASTTSTSVLPANVVQAVTLAQTNGLFTAPANLATLPVVGTIGSGTWSTDQVAGPFVATNGGSAPLLATAFVLGYAIANPQSIVGASLSSATAGLTSFEMDSTSTMGLPFTLGFTQPGGTAVPAGTTLDQPVLLNLVDASAGGTTASVAIAEVNATGTVLAGPINTALGTGTGAANGAGGICSATTWCAGIPLVASPPAGAQFVVEYFGRNQDQFQSATLSAIYNTQTIASFSVTNQSVVVTQTGAGFTAPSATVTGPLALAVGAGSLVYVSDNNAATTGRVIVETPAANPFTTPALAASAASTTDATVQYSAVTTDPRTASPVYATDYTCTTCTTSAYSLYAWNTATVAANAGTPVAITPNSSPFQSTVLAPFKAGPVGAAFVNAGITNSIGTQGDVYVAANNSIYRVSLDNWSGSATTTVTLVAGTGQPGVLGQGSTDSASGLTAKFNFGTTSFIGMTTDQTATGTNTVTALYVLDAGNGTIRKVSITGTNAVTTVASASQATGITYDPKNKLLYVSNAAAGTIASVSPTTGAAVGFAGTINSLGTADGLALQAYPVQFNIGNAVSNAAGTAPATQYAAAGLALTANFNAAAQAAAGVSSYLAKFNKTQSFGYDYATGNFYALDNVGGVGAVPALRALR